MMFFRFTIQEIMGSSPTHTPQPPKVEAGLRHSELLRSVRITPYNRALALLTGSSQKSPSGILAKRIMDQENNLRESNHRSWDTSGTVPPTRTPQSPKGEAGPRYSELLRSFLITLYNKAHALVTGSSQKSSLGDIGVNLHCGLFQFLKPRVAASFTLITLLLFSSHSKLLSQVYPISTTTSVQPPYPVTLDGFLNEGANKVNLQLMVNDATLSHYPVKLRLVLRNNSTRIYTTPAMAQQPIYLNGGEVSTLDALDLERYFQLPNLIFEGISKNQYQQLGQLPEGIYQLYFEVLDYYRDYVISSSLMNAMLWVYLNEPPMLNMPLNQHEVTINGPQNIMFSWVSRHSPFTHPGFVPEYVFDLWEVYPETLDPYQVARSTRPIYSQAVMQSSLFYTLADPELIPGRKYAWRVRATDPEQIARFKYDGYSEIFSFDYGRPCEPPRLSALTAGKDHIQSTWETPQRMEQFTLQYKPVNSSNDVWYTETTTDLCFRIGPLRSNTEYMVEVSGTCGTQQSEFSNRETIRTTQDLNFECGAGNTLAVPENRNPIPYLKRGDIIRAGDFDVEIAEVSGSNGIFSGKAYMLVPYLGFIKIITEFEGIEVNTDFELVSGEFITMYDLNNALIVAPGAGGFGLGYGNETGTEEANNFIAAADREVQLTDSVASVRLNGNTLVIEHADGTSETIVLGAEEVVAVTTASGEDYLIDNSTSTVYTQASAGGSAPAGGSSSLRSPSSGTASEYQVTFAASENDFFGFDAHSTLRPNANYKTATLAGEQVYFPWKSTEAGRMDKLVATIQGTPVDSVFYMRESMNMVMRAPGTESNQMQLMITGLGHEDEDELLAYYTQTEGSDSTARTTNYLAGKAALVAYDRQVMDLVLVAVNGSNCPTAAEVQTYLNKVYQPAIVSWNVQLLQGGLQVDLPGGTTLDNTDNDNLMDYAPEMKAVIREMKDHELYNNNSLYLFFFEASSERGAKGYMPLKHTFGFVYNNGMSENERKHTIAHEVGHGPFRLRHTFSSENEYRQSTGSSDNLMDYDEIASGVPALEKDQLIKYQWDLIHDPETMLFSGLESEEEGESQFWSDQVCTQKFIEQFRWAYTNNKKLEYQADGYPWFGHFANNIMLDGTTFEKISVEVKQDLGFVPSKVNYEEVYNRAVFNYGDALSIITEDKFSETSNYLFPTTSDWNTQIDDLILSAANENDRKELLKKLAILPYQEYKRFSGTQRGEMLKLITSGSITEDIISCGNDEDVVISLIRNVPDEQLSGLFTELQENNLMQELCSKIQNSFGEENYTKFIGALTSCFMRYRQDDMVYVMNNWKEYTQRQSQNGKITHFLWNRDFSENQRITYRKKYENNKIIIKTWPGGMFDLVAGDAYSYTRPPLDPFDIVTVFFQTPPKHVSEDIPSNTWLAMPAFMFEWYINEFHNKQIAAHLDGAVTAASFIIPITSISKGYKVLSTVHAVIGAINLSLLNDRFDEIVRNYLSNIDPSAYDKWQSFSYLVSVAGSPFQDIVIDQYLTKTTQFFALWNGFKNTEQYGYLMNDAASKEAILLFEGLYESVNLMIE